MRLKKLDINNFHCYQEEHFNFFSSTTVLIGKNGAGKTSLIKAVKTILSIFFSSNTKWGYSSLASAVSDLGVVNLGVRDVWHNEMMRPADAVEVKATADYNGISLPGWSFYKLAREKANVQSSFYKAAYIEFMKIYEQSGKLPLFAYYSDSFPHVGVNLGSSIKVMIDNDDKLDRSWGYYHWDSETSCAEIWQLRYMRIYRLLANFKSYYLQVEDKESAEAEMYTSNIEKYSAEIDYITKYLKLFTDNASQSLSDRSENLKISQLMVDGIDQPYIVALFADGSRRRWDELPAGYQRILNIVFDLAYRAYILNGHDSDVNGIVLIDEIDLHLHPELEQDVLQRFRIAFPHVQFIISTHSPLVISNFRQDHDNGIIEMTYENGHYSHNIVNDIFGMNYDLTLSLIMHIAPRNSYLEILQDMYIRLKRRNKPKAEDVLDQIRKLVSEERFAAIKSEIDNQL